MVVDIVWCGGWGVGSGSGMEVWELIVVVGSLGFWLGVAMVSCIGSGEIEGWGEMCIGVVCGWEENGLRVDGEVGLGRGIAGGGCWVVDWNIGVVGDGAGDWLVSIGGGDGWWLIAVGD